MSLAEAFADLDRAEDLIGRARLKFRTLEAREAPPTDLPPAEAQALPTAAPGPRHGLLDAKAFFDFVRARPPLGPTLSGEEVAGCERLLSACASAAFPVAWAAYVLATAYHETAGTLRPIREYGKGHGRPYGKPGRNRGQVAYGRGDVQLTWDENYERMDAELGLGGRLVANYELALDPAISARVIVRGMELGLFTGKSLGDRLPEIADLEQFTRARPIVNATDKAQLIAGYAFTFQSGLQAGGWR